MALTSQPGTPVRFEVTDAPSEADEQFVVAQIRAYNRRFTIRDARSLCVLARAEDGSIIGGLSGKTYWQFLEVSYLWVSEEHRSSGHASRLMAEAESEALQRGRKHALLDTFSFQAGEHERHYLHKMIDADA